MTPAWWAGERCVGPPGRASGTARRSPASVEHAQRLHLDRRAANRARPGGEQCRDRQVEGGRDGLEGVERRVTRARLQAGERRLADGGAARQLRQREAAAPAQHADPWADLGRIGERGRAARSVAGVADTWLSSTPDQIVP